MNLNTTTQATDINIITIDGSSGTGKGTLARKIATHFNYHLLDSGAIYRALALYAEISNVDFEDETKLALLAQTMPLQFDNHSTGVRVLLANNDVTSKLRLETTGDAASKVAKHASVRAALLSFQHNFAKEPGLVADGRDMGTTIFPNAQIKIFLKADLKTRAIRRQIQLSELSISATIDELIFEINNRDKRDLNRAHSPLCAAEDAYIIDTSDLNAEQVFNNALSYIQNKHPR